MYERALSLFTSDSSIWKPSRNNTFTWNVRAIPTNSLRLAKARTAGTLLALGYTWFARSFHPISFWLSALCVTQSFDNLKIVDYIGQIDEELADSFRAWPTDPDMPLISTSSLNTLLANYLNATVSLAFLFSTILLLIYPSFLSFRTAGPMNLFTTVMSSLRRLSFKHQPALFEQIKSCRL